MAKKAQTPLMKQYFNVKAKHPDKIVLFRMGDFYETFDTDAKTTSRVLGIVLTKRSNGAASDVPLAGFPHHALDAYLHKLLQAGLKVAICEQLEDPKKAKGLVKRGITEIVTPGTAVNDKFLDSNTNNYLASWIPGKDISGFAFVDISTGEFRYVSAKNETIIELIEAKPVAELLIPEHDNEYIHSLLPHYHGMFTKMPEWVCDEAYTQETITSHFKASTLKGFGLDDKAECIQAVGMILHYVKENFQKHLIHINAIRQLDPGHYLGLDRFTIRNLELFQRLSGETGEGTFFWSINETLTAMGSRMLRRWIYYPLLDMKLINDRLDHVTSFVDDTQRCEDIRSLLRRIADIERICAKIASMKVGPRELNTLRDSLKAVLKIPEYIDDELNFSLEDVPGMEKVIKMISEAIKDDPINQINKGGFFREEFHPEIKELRDISHGGKDYLLELQNKERKRLQIPTLKISYNRVFGYYIDVTKAHIDKVPEDYIRKQTLTNSERYITQELKEYEDKILNAEEKLISLEMALYEELLLKLSVQIPVLQANAKKVAQIDVLASFAHSALREQWIRPDVDDSATLEIKSGRHPVVEALLPPHEVFIPNDSFIDIESEQIHLITGPNMSGKSTYLRQIALITLMAQMGCFIPAVSARIGMVDKIFTRVGASDNLAYGESTFLTEMIETANILNTATRRSLILLDEIGRGTSTYDGLSIAWAVVEYLHNQPSIAARTLFATHYHELTDLENILERVKNYNVQVKEYGDKVIFLRKIIPGSTDKSYGIYVAQMAGVPQQVVKRANEILFNLSGADHTLPDGKHVLEPEKESENIIQLDIFSAKDSKLHREVEELDINTMTPLDAFQKLQELKKKVTGD
ncbi:MAG: DNA mismatch repair protein MutS [Candidatus Marinimicrobia bacterium]|nr:DNA mismatch repair protein MutS [Candidatus Neomarinimicrobiota bacterium]